MALAPMTTATKPIQTRGLFSAAGGTSYEDWQKTAGPGAVMPSVAPAQVDDSVANKVAALTKQDSPLMQAAATEGLKIANRRGLMNSSLAAGTSQTAALAYATPIASQDAAQAYGANQAARQFEYGMASQDSAQAFQAGESALGRDLEQKLQTASLAAAQQQQIRQIASTEGLAAAERALQDAMQSRDIASNQAMLGEQLKFQSGIAASQRDLDEKLQRSTLDAASAQQVRDIASREGIASAERSLQEKMQQQSIGNDQAMQQRSLASQEKIADWNLKSSDRSSASQLVSNMESIYSNQYAAIMANTSMDAGARTAQLTSIKNLRDTQLNLVKQLYEVQLTW